MSGVRFTILIIKNIHVDDEENIYFFLMDEVVEIVCEGSVTNKAILSSFCLCDIFQSHFKVEPR